MAQTFIGKIALVTGGSSGIGRATALAFAAHGASVVVASRRAEESQETVRQIVAAGGRALFVQTDVAQAAQVEAPAVIHTPMAERACFQDPAIEARVTAIHPLGRIGQPEEVAQAVIWLCSPAASFTTGHTLPIDGGLLA